MLSTLSSDGVDPALKYHRKVLFPEVGIGIVLIIVALVRGGTRRPVTL
jgi:hypothetical protein